MPYTKARGTRVRLPPPPPFKPCIYADKFSSYFGERIVGEIQADEIREYLDAPLGRSKAVPSLKTWNNRRGYLSTFFKFCLSKKYVAEDIILEVPKFKVKKARGTADTLSAEEATDLVKWLEKYPIEEYPIIPTRRFRDLWVDVREQRKLTHDVMRHTFISMTVGAFRSVGDASLQAGNSEAVIRKHYLDLKSVEEADAFWKIVPKGETLPELEKKDGRYVVTKKP